MDTQAGSKLSAQSLFAPFDRQEVDGALFLRASSRMRDLAINMIVHITFERDPECWL